MEYRWEPYNRPELQDQGLGRVTSNEIGVEPLVLVNVTLTDARKSYPGVRDMRTEAQLDDAVARHENALRAAYRRGDPDEGARQSLAWWEACQSIGELDGDVVIGPVWSEDVLA